MPTISVGKYALFEALGKQYTTKEFDELCFEFGIELDEDTEDDKDRPKDEAPQLKIEIPANRCARARFYVGDRPDIGQI